MKRVVVSGFFALLLMGFNPSVVLAQSSSTNYKVDEAAFGSGGNVNSTSSSYEAFGSAGGLGVGEAGSTTYRAYAGPISPNEEYLEMVVTPATVNFGNLSPNSTATGTAIFYVRAYLNSTYSVLTLSPPPTNESGDTLEPLASPTAPATGVEQFGINLVDNTSPNIGSNPVPEPNSQFANGQAATGYGTADQFKYANGDVIAQSGGSPAWGQTQYTISYIANINGATTEAGLYSMAHTLVAVPTF